MIEAQATARYVRTSAQKAGLVLALIRGKDVNRALATLKFTRKSIADGHRQGAAVGDRQRAAEGRVQRRRRPAVRVGVLREPGAVAEARAAGADGPRVPRAEADGASHGAGVGAAREGRRDRRRAASAKRAEACARAPARQEAGAAQAQRREEEAEGVRSSPDDSRERRSRPWARRFTRSDSGSGSTRRGGRGGTRTATTRSCCTRISSCAQTLKKRFAHAGVSKIETERAANKLKIDIYTSRPGIIIGRKGTEVDKLKQEIQKRTSREVFINIQEIQKPELDAQLISESVAMQLEKRVAFRRAMRKAVESALRFGARGIKVRVSGRLNGAEIARSEWYLHGQLPLQTLRADIDYGFAEANTTYGQIGIKVWLYKGERLVPQRGREEEYRERAPRRPQARDARSAVRSSVIGHWAINDQIPDARYQMQGFSYVDAEESQVPQAAARPHARQGVARVRRVVRRLRAEGARAVLADRSADRGGARRDDAVHRARRQDLGARVSRQADHQEAAGNPHGQGQGRARAVGRASSGPAGCCSRWKASPRRKRARR